MVQIGLKTSKDTGNGIFSLRDTNQRAQEDSGNYPKVQRGEGDAVSLYVDESCRIVNGGSVLRSAKSNSYRANEEGLGYTDG